MAPYPIIVSLDTLIQENFIIMKKGQREREMERKKENSEKDKRPAGVFAIFFRFYKSFTSNFAQVSPFPSSSFPSPFELSFALKKKTHSLHLRENSGSVWLVSSYMVFITASVKLLHTALFFD